MPCTDVTVTRTPITAEAAPLLRELYGIEQLPLAPADITATITGSTALVNALRRTVTDEMPGHRLTVVQNGLDTVNTTEPFMVPFFVHERIMQIPLWFGATEGDQRFRIDVRNTGTSNLAVYSSDMKPLGGEDHAMFNPTFEVGFLRPGNRLYIHEVLVTRGLGRDHASYNVMCCARFRHLDIAEHPRSATHAADGAHVNDSGYATSVLVADPRRHEFSAMLPATQHESDAVNAMVDACDHLAGRLRRAQAAVGGAQYAAIQLENGLTEGILQLPGETHTVGELLRRKVCDLYPDVSYVSQQEIAHEGVMRFVLRLGDATAALVEAIRACIEDVDAVREGFQI